MDSLEQLVAALRKERELLESLGKDILLYVDQSEVAGHRYGFVYSEVLHALSSFDCRELTLQRAEEVKKLGQMYLCLDHTLENPGDQEGYEKINFPEPVRSVEGTDSRSILHHNAYTVFQNLNTHAQTLISNDKKPHSGLRYALAWGSLFSLLKLDTVPLTERTIRELAVDGLQAAFNYMRNIFPPHSQAFIDIFKGYQEGPKLESNGAYGLETNVEIFCRGAEKVILSALRL